MAPSKKFPPWQEMRRTLSAKSKTALLNLIRDLYALNPENKDLVRTQARAPKAPVRRKVMVKDIRSGKTFAVVSSGKTPALAPRSQMSAVIPKIRRLAQMAAELQQGNHFEVTRLTTLKSLCEDAHAAAQFALYLAKLTDSKMREKNCPSHLAPEQWDTYKGLVAKALEHMDAYVEEPSEQTSRALWSVESEVREVQNTYRNQAWGPVRIIHSTEVLLIEYALSCLLQPTASADWGYHLARQYAERYDPRYATGLIPESAPMVEDIVDFWCQYHLGKSLRAWMADSKAS
jgi:hypothetical protein